MPKLQIWVKNALLHIIKKNYYHKKSGIRLTIDEKHEWDRVVRPIEHAMGKILLVHPYVPPVVVLDGPQAMLHMLKSGSAPKVTPLAGNAGKGGKSQIPASSTGIGASMTAGSSHIDGPGSPAARSSRPTSYSSPEVSSRPTTADGDLTRPNTAEDDALQRGIGVCEMVVDIYVIHVS